MSDEAIKVTLRETLKHYTPEQLAAPDKKYGTVEKRLEVLFHENPKKVEEEILREIEEQHAEVGRQATGIKAG